MITIIIIIIIILTHVYVYIYIYIYIYDLPEQRHGVLQREDQLRGEVVVLPPLGVAADEDDAVGLVEVHLLVLLAAGDDHLVRGRRALPQLAAPEEAAAELGPINMSITSVNNMNINTTAITTTAITIITISIAIIY